MVFPIAGGTQDTSYEISNSLRFNDDDSPNLSITPSSAGNRAVWTWSAWVKISNIKSGAAPLFTAGDWTGGSTATGAIFYDSQIYTYWNAPSGGTSTTAKFRDPSAWYHIVLQANTSTLKVYVNSVEQSSKSISGNGEINNTSAQVIGKYANTTTDYFDGYMSEINFVDGSAKAPTNFGETNDNGVWIPKKYTGSYGTNGFFLEFKQTGTSANASGIGADTSGNGNHLTPTNLAAIDVTTDTPMNNFATMNPLVYPYANITYSEGNLKLLTGNSENSFTTNTMAPANGKWYTEIKVTDVGSDALLGITRLPVPVGPNHYPGQQAYDVAYYSANGQKATGGSFSSYGNSYTTNDIVGIAMDLDNDKVYFSKNGTYQNSGDPTSGATGTGAISIPSLANENFVFIAAGEWNGSDTSTFEVNFGNPSYSISSGNADANGYGNFEYAPPSGYYSLCTKNLAEFG